jgi:hypothetical protein
VSDIHSPDSGESSGPADAPVTETGGNENHVKDSGTASPPKPKPCPFLDRLQTGVLVIVVLCLCFGFLALFAAFTMAYLWSDYKEKDLLSVQSAGRVLAVSQTTGLLTRGLVETDTGYYSVIDGVSLNKHEALTLQTRGNRARFLCDSQQRCVALTSTPGPEQAP